MNEEQKKENKETPQADIKAQGEPIQNTENRPDLISEANLAAERLEKANIEHKALIIRQENLFAQQRLGGRTEAGQPVIAPKVETPREYANRVLNGLVPLQ